MIFGYASVSTINLISLVEQVEKKCTNIKSLKESWLDTTKTKIVFKWGGINET
ncbi:MAG: hypothetical protein ACI8WT_004009 [Clostridium sp.]|jgi:hypothetical protein